MVYPKLLPRLLLTPCLFLLGCATSRDTKVPTYQRPRITTADPAFNTLSVPERAAHVAAMTRDARDTFMKDLKTAHEAILRDVGATLNTLKEMATRYSNLHIGVGASGVLAGIAAAALVAASPANAATVAGLTTYGSGVVGFQTMVASEGFTRETVAKVHLRLLGKVETAEENFEAAYKELNVTDPDEKWETCARKAEAMLMQLRSHSVFVPMGEVEPPPESKPKDPKPSGS